MSKHEFPPFVMTIENGRLVPANPHDAERLNSYRRGTKVFVRLTEEKDRVLVRKWWAILGLVVKQCETPWKTKEAASEAVKLALGIVNLSKTVGGQFMQYPKSLTELDDPEMSDALEQMTELLSRITGVDVETLKKETAHIVPEEQLNPDDATPPASSDSSESATEPGSGDNAAHSTPLPQHADDLAWLKTVAIMLWAATNTHGNTDDNLELLNNQRKAAPELAGASQAVRDKAGSIYRLCKEVVMHEKLPANVLPVIATHAGCNQSELGVK
jgi:hypothetical protein